MDILLECTDGPARLYVGNLVKFVINQLKTVEKDKLFLSETIKSTNE
jgi:hypothetical protein